MAQLPKSFANRVVTAAVPSLDAVSFWADLFDLIDEQRVVPVVGPDLLQAQSDGADKNFYTIVAEQLASNLGVAPPQRTTLGALNDVACRFLDDQRQRPEDLHPKVGRIIRALEADFPLPDPLLQIARLPVKLFVTTTSDRLLVRAIETSQPQWQGRVRVVEYSPVRPEEFSLSELEQGGPPIVFHLFGRASATPEYVVTEEDALEFMHALHSQVGVLDFLRKANLLVVGCGFPDWMARFFLRLSRPQRLSDGGGKQDWLVADEGPTSELGSFISHYSHRTRYLPFAAERFTAELGRALPEYLRRASVPALQSPRDPARDIVPGAVFLSYASEDREIVAQICEMLQEHLDCWFDRQQLLAGDDWEKKISRNVAQCYVFVPIISRHTLTAGARFFREEWQQAISQNRRFPPNRKFLFPLAIDDTAANDPALHQEIKAANWTRVQIVDQKLPPRRKVRVPDEFIQALKEAYQAAQLPEADPR